MMMILLNTVVFPTRRTESVWITDVRVASLHSPSAPRPTRNVLHSVTLQAAPTHEAVYAFSIL